MAAEWKCLPLSPTSCLLERVDWTRFSLDDEVTIREFGLGWVKRTSASVSWTQYMGSKRLDDIEDGLVHGSLAAWTITSVISKATALIRW